MHSHSEILSVFVSDSSLPDVILLLILELSGIVELGKTQIKYWYYY